MDNLFLGSPFLEKLVVIIVEFSRNSADDRYQPAVDVIASLTLISRLLDSGVRSPAMMIPSNLFAERIEAVLKPKGRCDLKAATILTRHTKRSKSGVEQIIAADEKDTQAG